MMINLAFLSPEIVKAAVEGKLPRGSGISRLSEAPMNWKDQEHARRAWADEWTTVDHCHATHLGMGGSDPFGRAVSLQ